MKRASRLLIGLATALIGWSGIAAIVTATVGKFAGQNFTLRGGGRWFIAWSLFLAPLIVWSIVTGAYPTAVQFIGQAVFGVAAGVAFLGASARPQLKWWLLAGLASLLLAAGTGAYLSPRLLRAYEGATLETRLTARGVAQLITSVQQGPVAHRSWLHAGAAGYALRGYVRAGHRADQVPAAVTITLDWPGRATTAQTSLEPTSSWTSFEVQVSEDQLDDPEFLIARLYSSEPGSFEVRALRLDALSGLPAGTPRSARQELVSGHPVLLAHLAVALGAAVLALTGPSAAGLLGILIALLVAFVAGSRGALAVMAIWSLLIPLETTWSRARKVIAFFVIAALALGAGLMTQGVRSVALGSAPSRTSIWAVAWDAFLSHPLLGLKGAGVDPLGYFQTHTSSLVNHAHNFVLQYAASYGIFGALAAVLILAAFLGFSIRYRGARGLVVLLPVLVLNMVDATLFDARILVATTFAINAFEPDHGSATPDHATLGKVST